MKFVAVGFGYLVMGSYAAHAGEAILFITLTAVALLLAWQGTPPDSRY